MWKLGWCRHIFITFFSFFPFIIHCICFFASFLCCLPFLYRPLWNKRVIALKIAIVWNNLVTKGLFCGWQICHQICVRAYVAFVFTSSMYKPQLKQGACLLAGFLTLFSHTYGLKCVSLNDEQLDWYCGICPS